MQILTLVLSLIGFLISIVVLVKFLQIAADIRSIRQSIPLAYKFNLEGPEDTIKIAEMAIKMGDKAYARQILLRVKTSMIAYAPDSFTTQIAQIDKMLSEI